MKTSAPIPTHIARPVSAALALFAVLWTISTASAQPTITLTQLLAQGFTNGPLTGYSLKVTGIRNISSAVFNDIRPEPTAGGAVQAHGGNVQLYGLNYAVAGASVEGGKLSFNGSISLPPPLSDYESAVADAHGLVVGASGNIAFDQPGGAFTIPKKFVIGALTLDSVTLIINPAAQTFGGSALIGLGRGSVTEGLFCNDRVAGPKLFGASVLVSGGKLDELGVMGSNLRRPLGIATEAFLDVLGARVGNLAANGGRDWYVQGSATVNAGCPPVGGPFPVSIHATATVNSAGFIEILGAADIFAIPVGSAYLRYNPPYTVAAGASVNFVNVFFADCGFQATSGAQFSGFGRGRLDIPRFVPVAGGFTFAAAEASFNNSGFRGSVTVNVAPEIPRVCTPSYCLPGGCIYWWSPKWSSPRRTCKRCWDGPCIPAICTPRIPAVSATIGFKFQNGGFTFGAASAPADPMVEPWEKSFQETIVEPETGDRLSFMANWARVDKCSTGPCGRPIASGGGFSPASDPPPVFFNVPAGEESVMFRLIWESPSNSFAFMRVRYLDYPALSISSDEVSPTAHILRPLDSWPGAYMVLDGSRREAIIGIPNPPAGQYSVELEHTEALGNYAVELLRQNLPPLVTVESVSQTESPTEYAINYTTTLRQGNPPTRFMLAQVECVPGTTRRVKAGGIYLVDTIASLNGERTYYLHTDSLNVPDGEYHVIVNIDDPQSLEVEAISTQKITVRNAEAPEPVPSFATRANAGGFTISWQPSPSSNILSYIVAYTKSALGNEFEFNVSTDAGARTTTITNLSNGQPYLVTVFAMGTNSLQSRPAEKQRVIPTEGYGLNAPIIVSKPRVGATVDQSYVYFPEIFDADDVLRPSAPLPDGEEFPPTAEPQDGQGRRWTLVTAPAGMTIDPSGVILWTPNDQQVTNHTVTVRVTDLSSLPPLQDAGSLVSPRFGEQTYTLTVVGANNPPAFERNHYRFLTTPPATAYEGEVYRYVPVVLFPTNKFTLTIDDGPPGLTVVQEGTAPNTTNVVLWTVPANALGHRVVLRAVPDLGPETSTDDTVLQEYFLDVSAPSKRLPQPTFITRATPTPEGFGLRWVGNAAAYQVQRATNLFTPTNTVWQNTGGPRPGDAVNFHVDTNAVPGGAFYRVLEIP